MYVGKRTILLTYSPAPYQVVVTQMEIFAPRKSYLWRATSRGRCFRSCHEKAEYTGCGTHDTAEIAWEVHSFRAQRLRSTDTIVHKAISSKLFPLLQPQLQPKDLACFGACDGTVMVPGNFELCSI